MNRYAQRYQILIFFLKIIVLKKPECEHCDLSAGGYHATAILFNDDIYQPHAIECNIMKHKIKLGVWTCSKLGTS